MKTLLLLVHIAAGLIFFTNSLANETTRAGSTAAQFLKIGIGARVQALGGAAAGLRDDVSLLYWNPAGIAGMNKISCTGTHASWLADIKHQFTGIIFPVSSNFCLGLGVILLTVPDEEITTVQQPHGTGMYWNASDLALGLSFATRLTDRFSIGVTGKYISQRIYNESASTFAFDLGTSLKTDFKGLIVGMAIGNLGRDLKLEGRDLIRSYKDDSACLSNHNFEVRLDTEPWPLPVNFKMGVALFIVNENRDSFFQSENHSLLLALDLNHPNDEPENFRLGTEYELYRIFNLRGGLILNTETAKFSLGAGFKSDFKTFQFSFDYALASYLDLGFINFFSFGVQF